MNNEPTSNNPARTLELGDSRWRRRTKIVATLGPACESREVLERMIANGLDVVRLNFSHGAPGEHAERARLVRELAAEHGRDVGIIGDLQGPKIRIERFADGEVRLRAGERFVLDAGLDRDAGDGHRVGITYKNLPKDVERGDTLLLDDGRIVLQVERVHGAEIHTRVATGGPVSNNKGINRQGGGLTADAITDKDVEDIRTAAEIDVDYLAVSFPRNAHDVDQARRLFLEAGGEGGIIAKIERAEALEEIDGILEVSDAIMIARGDLGVEIGDAELPPAQKALIRAARNANVPVITATQMMESMINSPLPTRAEVFDIANAVLDGTDAVMLSAETASGNYPAEAVQAMARVCAGVDQHPSAQMSDHRMNVRFERTDEAIAMATMYVANHLDVRAIASLTESGSTPLWMSRISSGIPIYALTRHERTSRRVSLYRGVYAVSYPIVQVRPDEANRAAIDVLLERGALKKGDRLVITKGDLMGVHGGTNSLKIVVVGTDDEFAPPAE